MIVIYNQDKVLLVKRKNTNYFKNYYGLPGGKIENGETPEEAAKRELLEETGISLIKTYQLPKKFYMEVVEKNGKIKKFVGYVFLGIEWAGKLTKTKETEPVWVNLKDLEKFKLLPNTKEAIQLAMKYVRILK